MRSIGNSSNSSRCRGSMIAVTILMVISWFPIARYFYKLGLKKEQQARLRRLNTLKRLINNRADL